MKFSKIKILKLILTLLFGVFMTNSVFAQTEGTEQGKYIEKQYLFIPWGYGNGQLPSSAGNGPGFFKVDKNGDVYVYCYDNKQHTLLRFDSAGNEIGRIVLEGVPFKFKVEEDKIFIVYALQKEIEQINKDLKSDKKIRIPDSFQPLMSDYENGVIYKNKHDLKSGPQYYIYDQDEWIKAGNPSKPTILLSKVKYEEKMDGNELAIYLLYPSGNEVKIWSTQDRVVRNIKILGEDRFSNTFVQISYSPDINAIMDSTVLRVSPSGKVLNTLNFKPDDVVEVYCGGRVIPMDIDNDGNIFRMRTSGSGVYVDEWSFSE